MKIKRYFGLFLVFLFILTVPLAVLSAESGGNLTIANPADIKKLDPIQILDQPSSRVANLVFDHLANYDFDGEVVPELAKSWEFSEDGKVVTFYLRDDVEFHDGTKFNAEAVKYNFERILDPDEAAPGKKKFEDAIEEVEVVDDYTVNFHLTEPNAAFIDLYIIDNSMMIVSPAATKKYGDDFALHPVGSGPFKFEEYREAEHVKLSRNEDYWMGAPKLAEVTFKPIPELQTRVVELETGGVDLIFRVPPEELKRLENDKNITVQKSPYASIRGLFFQMDSFLGDEPEVRKAIAYGLKLDEIFQAFLNNVAVRCKSIVPVDSWAYFGDVFDYDFDPDRAKELLEEAGWVDQNGDGVREKDGQKLEFTIMSPDGRYLRDKEISEAATHMLKQIGIAVNVEVLEWGAFIDKLMAANFDMVFLGWMQSTLEPAKFFNPLVKTGGRANFFNYSNPELDELLAEGTKTFEQSERKEIYRKATEVLMEDAQYIPIFDHMGMVAQSKELKGYTYSASRSLDLLDATIEN